MNIATRSASTRSENAIRAMLSLRETVVLGEIPEKLVRKDIENGWLKRRTSADHRLWFRWLDVVLLAGVYRNESLTGALRKRALDKVEFLACSEPVVTKNITWRCSNWGPLHIDNYLYIDFSRVADDVGRRVELYAEGLNRIEEKSTILGGEAVFSGTRLSVRHIGAMYERGEPIDNILADYPYLNEDDVRFAHLYYLAHPMLGRPRTSVETKDDDAEIDVG